MSYRKLQIGDRIFEYSIGSGVKIKSKGLKSKWIESCELLGMSAEEYRLKSVDKDDYAWKWKVPIGPQDIKNYILEQGWAK